MRFTSFALAPVLLATFDLSGRQITVIIAAVIVPPVAVASMVFFHHLIIPFFERNRFEKAATGPAAFDPLGFYRTSQSAQRCG
jgi:hypothetical protein